MKSLLSVGGIVVVLLAARHLGLAAAPTTAPVPNGVPVAPVAPPKSDFENGAVKPPYRDPFFPKSSRYLVNQAATPTPKSPGEPQTPPPPVDCYADIVVKGISISTRRFATVNNQTFAPGDELAVKTPRGSVKLKVLEIKDRSVVVKADGNCEPKELPLKY
jgi:hypothetical protein